MTRRAISSAVAAAPFRLTAEEFPFPGAAVRAEIPIPTVAGSRIPTVVATRTRVVVAIRIRAVVVDIQIRAAADIRIQVAVEIRTRVVVAIRTRVVAAIRIRVVAAIRIRAVAIIPAADFLLLAGRTIIASPISTFTRSLSNQAVSIIAATRSLVCRQHLVTWLRSCDDNTALVITRR